MQTKYRNDVKTSQGHCVERNCRFYNITQHLSGDSTLFSNWDFAAYRMRMFSQQCETYGVVIVHTLVMPNHTHDIVYCNCYEDVAAAIRATNIALSRVASSKYGFPKDVPLFSTRPRYKAVRSLLQYYVEAFYIFMNPLNKGLTKVGFEYEHSSFHLLSKGIVPRACDMDIYSQLLGMSYADYAKLLNAPVPVYMAKIKWLCFGRKQWQEDRIFKIDPSKPYTSNA